MYTIKSTHDSYQLISLAFGEIIFEHPMLEVINQFLFAREIVKFIAPELDTNLFLDNESNCSCDDYGDIWINPSFILKLQELTGEPLEVLLVIVISHELGHAFLLEASANSLNEVAAWAVGEELFLRYTKEELNIYQGVRDALLCTYKSEDKYLFWFEEAEMEASKGLSLLESL